MEVSSGEAQEFPVFTDYFDQIRITIFPAVEQMVDDGPLEWHLVSTRSGELDLNSLESAVAEFVQSLSGVTAEGRRYPPPYRVSISKRHFSWGADATSLDVVLAVAEWAAASAAWDLLKAFARRVGSRIRGDEHAVSFVEEEDAARLARQVIYTRHSVPPDMLHVRSIETTDAGVAGITFVDHNEVTYECSISGTHDSIAIIRIIRTFPDDADG